MRLLHVHTLKLWKFHPGDIPSYAIASHRWGKEEEEAAMKDISNGLDQSKSGHKKVLDFVNYVANHLHGIDWIWIDTCCIDKTSSQELSEAIISMFGWYQRSEVCLAYMGNVPTAIDMIKYSGSDWFQRGWTLQELLAPNTVIFLSQTWDVIGYKGSDGRGKSGRLYKVGPCLNSRISSITQVPKSVLKSYAQSEQFSPKAKLRWSEGRETTREEDMVYCLLGIFDASMNALYGEGRDKAMRRLLKHLADAGEPLHDGLESPLSRCVSAPHGPVSTYTGCVPLRPAGSVIFASQDRYAAQMIGRDSAIVKVDAMSTQQAISLLLRSIGNTKHDEIGELRKSAEKVVTALDKLPWAIDIAGASISADWEDRDALQITLQRFLIDLERHSCDVLGNRAYDTETSLYKKDIRAVWDTTFQSLQRIEAENANAHPLQLLRLLASFDDAGTADNVFRLASFGLGAMCDVIKPEIPSWLKNMLKLGVDGKWEDFLYRSDVRILIRYGLVRTKSDTGTRLEMHSLLRRKIREDLTFEKRMEVLTPLLTAAGHQRTTSGACAQSQTQLIGNAISEADWLKWRLSRSNSSLTSMHLFIGKAMLTETTSSTLKDQVIAMANRQPSGASGNSSAIDPMNALGVAYTRYSPRNTDIAREMVTMKTVEAMKKTFGLQHVETARTMYYFALNCRERGELGEAARFFRQSVCALSTTLGFEHEQTVYAMQYLGLTLLEDNYVMEAHDLLLQIENIASRMIHERRANAMDIITCVAESFDKEGWRRGAECVLDRAIQDLTELLGETHPDTCEAIRRLVLICPDRGPATPTDTTQPSKPWMSDLLPALCFRLMLT